MTPSIARPITEDGFSLIECLNCLQEGRKKDEMVVIEDLLAKLTCTKYPWVELQERPLPEGVDPLKLEFYLVDNEFEVKTKS